MELRDYQRRAVEGVRDAIRRGARSVVMVSPTGSGKSVIFGQIIRQAVDKRSIVLWLVHRRNLVIQMRDTLRQFDIEPGIIMAGIESDTDAQVQLGTIQTYARRLKLDELDRNRFFIDADLLMIDEAHRAVSRTTKKIVQLYKDKILVGCTATPVRADGNGLGQVFDALVDVVGVRQLTEEGHLAPAKYFVPAAPDLEKIKIVRGDYDSKELGRRQNQPKLVGDVVDNWLRIAGDLPTIVFAVNVKHSIALRDKFRRRGINAEHLDAKSPDDEREFVFAEVERGQVRVVTNVAVYQEGLDVPGISCVVMARPTKSLGLYRQCCGRGLRPGFGKSCIIIDHGGVVEEHGFLDDDVTWSLSDREKAWKARTKSKIKKPVQCRVCKAVFSGANKCPECGSPVKTFGKPVAAVDADLVEVGGKAKATMAEKRRWYGMLEYRRREKGYQRGWTAHKYVARYGVWPKGMGSVLPIQPDTAFESYMKHLLIKYVKGKKKWENGSTSIGSKAKPPGSGQESLPITE